MAKPSPPPKRTTSVNLFSLRLESSPLQAAIGLRHGLLPCRLEGRRLRRDPGSLIQVLIPRNWLVKTRLGSRAFQGTLLGTIFSLPGMMCSCCAAPVAAGYAPSARPMGGAGVLDGNPLLNPATLVFMGFVLGWHFAFIRLVAGLLTVLVVATLVQNW